MKKNYLLKSMALGLAITLSVPMVSSNAFVIPVEAAYAGVDYQQEANNAKVLEENVKNSKDYVAGLLAESMSDPASSVANYELASAEWDKVYDMLSSEEKRLSLIKIAVSGAYPYTPNNSKTEGPRRIEQPSMYDESLNEKSFSDYFVAKSAYETNPSEEKLETIKSILAIYGARKTKSFDYAENATTYYLDGLLYAHDTNAVGNTDIQPYEVTGSDLNSLKLKMRASIYSKGDYLYDSRDDHILNWRTDNEFSLTKRPEYLKNGKVTIECKYPIIGKKSMTLDPDDFYKLIDITPSSVESDYNVFQNRLMYHQALYNYNMANMYFNMLHNDMVAIEQIRDTFNESALPQNSGSVINELKNACESDPSEDNFIALSTAMLKDMCYKNTNIDYSSVNIAYVNKEFDFLCLVYKMKSEDKRNANPYTKFYHYSTDLNNITLNEIQIQYISADGKTNFVLGGTSIYCNNGKNTHNVVSTTVNSDGSVTVSYKEYLLTKTVTVYPTTANTYVFTRANITVQGFQIPSDCYSHYTLTDGKVLIFLSDTNLCTYLDDNGQSKQYKTNGISSTYQNVEPRITYYDGLKQYYVYARALFDNSTPSVYSLTDAIN